MCHSLRVPLSTGLNRQLLTILYTIDMKATYDFRTGNEKKLITVEVEVLDYKELFGRKMCLITPVRGKGKVWVNQDKVKVVK